ncbi:MAG: sigma 54-interacting transcriptional regulator [Pseudomonadota bacterium]
MLELALQRGRTVLTRHTVGDAPITIGRGSDNILRLVDPEISRHHCRIERKGEVLRVTDLSTNGTLVNGKAFRDATIRDGDRLSIGPWTIMVEESAGALYPNTVASPAGATRIVSFDAQEKLLTTESIELTINSPGQSQIKKIFSSGEVTIGQNASSGIFVSDPYVSRRHCRIESIGSAARLVDLGSTNGTYVNGVRIGETLLGPAGNFCIGRTTVLFRIIESSEKLAESKSEKLGSMIGPSKAMRGVFALIERVGPTGATVCITGESGTGKELAARELHDGSPRRRGPFVAVNCGAVPASIIESQLFGHERGAFTGAVERMAGLIEQARGGTLFLDEIGEMPLDMQTRLLRVLETKTLRRVGGQDEIPVDVRLVCATNRDLKRLVEEGRFREDLFFRIFVVPLHLPPLRERPEDIGALIAHLIPQLSAQGKHPVFTDGAIEKLSAHTWPGNVRELKNTLERTLLLSEGNVIDADELKIEKVKTSATESGHLKDRERGVIAAAISECNGNLSNACRRLGIARTTLQKKIKKYGIVH